MSTHVRERESHIPSRREALRTVGFSGLAAAIPVTAVALAAEPQPDAALIHLGAEFDQLHRAWLPLWRRWVDLEVAAREAAGNFAGDQKGWYERYCSAAAGNGCIEAGEANDAAVERLRIVVDKIQATPAQTFAGLHAKARVVLYESFDASGHIGVPDADMDWDVLCFVRLVREIATLAGEARA